MNRVCLALFIVGSFAAAPLAAAPITYLHHFTGNDGARPDGGLVTDGHRLYGVAADSPLGVNIGSVFAIDLDGDNFQVLYDNALTYPSAGIAPNGRLSLVDSTLFGVTLTGNPAHAGSLFALTTDGSDFRVVHQFDGLAGANPWEGPRQIGNRFYGTTNAGGATNNGTLYSIAVDGSDFQVLYDFAAGLSGRRPIAAPIAAGEILYGTTVGGGEHDFGLLYSIAKDGTGFSPLHSFDRTEAYPYAGVIVVGSRLFGATNLGGEFDAGTIFSVELDGADFQVLHNFNGQDGSAPSRDLLFDGGRIYGSTFVGGVGGDGVVFSLSTDGTDFKVLHNFSDQPDGSIPESLLLIGSTLYGVTNFGGDFGAGTIFAITVPEPSSVIAVTIGVVCIVTFLLVQKRYSFPKARSEHDV